MTRLTALAQRLNVFLSGSRLVWAMCLFLVGGLLAYTLLLPSSRRIEGAALAVLCLAAAAALTRLPVHLFTTLQPKTARALLLAALLAGGALYAWLAPPWPDERSILAAAQSVAENGTAAFLRGYASQPWAGTRHPPLMPLLNGLLLQISGGGLFTLRLASLLLTAGSLLAVERAARMLYGERAALPAAALFLGMPAALRVGATALSDMFVAALVTAALLCTLELARSGKLLWAALAGLLAGIGLLVKYTAGLFFAAAALWFLLLPELRRQRRGLALVVTLALALPGAWLLLAAQTGVFAQQAETLGTYAGMVAGNPFGRSMLARTLLFSLPAALGLQNLPLLVKALARAFIRPSAPIRLAWGWALAVMLPVLFTLPDFRYLLAAFPALAALSAHALDDENAASRARVALFGLVCSAALLWILNRAAPSAVVPFQ